MNWNSFINPMRMVFSGGPTRFVMPTLAFEIQPHFVAGARLDSSRHVVRRLGMRELEANTVAPLPNGPNIANLENLRLALRGVSEVIGNGGGRLGLLLPDGSVRTAILSFETLPDDPRQVDTLVRWRMKEYLAYPSDEAKVSYQILWRDAGGVGVMVLAAKQSLLAEYTDALGLKNGGPELILPATAALLPLLPDADQLLVHVCSGWVTTTVTAARRLALWRTKAVDGLPDDLANQVGAEVTRVLASCRDHLHVEPEKVWLCARGTGVSPVSGHGQDAHTPELAPILAGLISKEVTPLASEPKWAEALPAAEQTVFQSVGAPFAGLLANAR